MSVQSMVPGSISRFFGTAPVLSDGPKRSTLFQVAEIPVVLTKVSYGSVQALEVFFRPECEGRADLGARVDDLFRSVIGEGVFSAFWLCFHESASFQLKAGVIPRDIGSRRSLTRDGSGAVTQYECRTQIDFRGGIERIGVWLRPDQENPIPEAAVINMGATAMLVDEATSRVLLVQGEGQDFWKFPGGASDRLEAPDAVAERELREETGVDIRAGALRSVVLIDMKEFPGHPCVRAINLGFAFFGSEWPAVAPRAGEISQAKWFPMDQIKSSGGTLDGLKVGPELISAVNAIEGRAGFSVLSDRGFMKVWGSSGR